jgi:hypothetical protein
MTRVYLALAGLVGILAPSLIYAATPPPRLSLPIACKPGVTCEIQTYVDRDPGPGVQDYRCGGRTNQGHSGIDIRLRDMAAQRAGVDVLAAAPGQVLRLRDGVADISVKAVDASPVAGRECGNAVVVGHGDGWETQYCHLAQGSLKVKVGDTVKAGQPIARVGLSGDTEFPHLHFTIRHGGLVIDPFRPGPGAACDAQASSAGGLWDATTAKVVTYQAGTVLNAGFAADAVTMPTVEAGAIPAPGPASPGLVAYVRTIGLKAGDVQSLVLKDPKGLVLAENHPPALVSNRAQDLLYAGKKRPATGWALGEYQAVYTLSRSGAVVISRAFRLRL